jgi:type I restriction enzyme S subunit
MELKEPKMKAGVKQGFKSTEVGLIPEDWEVVPLDSIAFVTSGKRLPLGRSLTEHRTNHPYIRVTDMRMGTVDLDEIKYVPEDVYPAIKRYRIYKYDIFISVAGTLGIVGTIPDELDGANLTENANRITEIKCDRVYLLYVLMAPLIQSTIDELRTVGAQPKLALTRIRKFDIALPPTNAEQHAIATALSDVDGLISGLEGLLAKKRALKQGAMQQLLSGQKRLPGFTGKWEVTSVENVVQRVTGFWGASTQTKDTPRKANIIRAGDISPEGRLVATAPRYLSDAAYARACCVKGDVVITVSGNGLGKVWLSDGRPDVCASNFVRVLKPRKPLVGAFLYYKLGTSEAQQLMVEYTATSAYPNLRPSFFSANWMHLPSAEEQTAIATVLSDMDAELGALEAKLGKTRLLKEGMMQELLTGKTRLV